MSWNNIIPAAILGQVKQVIVVRKDLNMRKGKIAAQAAHASTNVFLNRLERDGNAFTFRLNLRPYEISWLDGSSRRTKICVYVNSEEELKAVYTKALAAGLLSELVLDAGLTEFKEPTLTCCAIGPAPAEEIDKITGNLPLY